MKKLLILLALVPGMAVASIDTNLSYKMTSPDVTELQDFLHDKGLLAVNPTGYFGLQTLRAVKNYQLSVGITNTGYVGKLTRASINAELDKEVSTSTEEGTTTPVIIAPITKSPIPVIIVQPATQPTTSTSAPSPVIITAQPKPMPTFTISDIVSTLTNKPNTGKYTWTFTVSDNPTGYLVRYKGQGTEGGFNGSVKDGTVTIVNDIEVPVDYTISVYDSGTYPDGHVANTKDGSVTNQ